MAKTPPTLLQEIEAFLATQKMGASYFGKKAVGNSEVVPRLRDGGRIWPETEARLRSFMLAAQAPGRKGGHVSGSRARQAAPVQKNNQKASA